jgi:hypothetical protein
MRPSVPTVACKFPFAIMSDVTFTSSLKMTVSRRRETERREGDVPEENGGACSMIAPGRSLLIVGPYQKK